MCRALFAAALVGFTFPGPCAGADGLRATFSVRSFGAVGDGKTLDTGAINKAISACARAGGGTVEFEPGNYLAGTIEILSNVMLDLKEGSRITGSPNLADYRSIGRSTEGRSTSLIVAVGAKNLGIRGPGLIDGNGRAFVKEPSHPHPSGLFYEPAATRQGRAFEDRGLENRDGPDEMTDRPGVLVLFVECSGIALHDFKVVDAPNWCIHLAGCHAAEIKGLDVRNSLRIPNADALDLASSQDIRVSNCYLEAGDDGIAVSPCADGYSPMIAENITVSDCVIVSRSCGIRLGWAAKDIRNLTFEHLRILNSNRGIGIFVRGSENIENVRFSDIVIETHLVDGQWWGLGEPVHISVVPYGPPMPLGRVNDISFVNVLSTSDEPVVLYSEDPGHIRHIVFRGYRQTIRENDLNRFYGGNLDLRPTTPKSLGIRRQDLAGLVAIGVDDLDVRGFALGWKGNAPDYFTSGIELMTCKRPLIDGAEVNPPRPGSPGIHID